MQTYEILVKNRAVVGNSRDMTLVRTSVGIDRVHILFDNAEWLDFPITVTFGQGDTMITEALVVSGLDSVEWVAEASCDIPWEVINKTGPIRVTLQGTDSSGNHIITAKGAPLAVEEAGDVVEGEDPSDAPTVSEWRQAMADAMIAVNNAATLVNTLQDNLDAMIADAQAAVDSYVLPIAAADSLGGIKVGNNLSITEDGTLSAVASSGSGSSDGIAFTQEYASILRNLQLLAEYAFDTDFVAGVLQNTVTVKPKALPKAKINAIGGIKVDNETVMVSTDGTVTVPRYTLPVATAETLGGVKPDGVTIINNDGAVSVPTADPETLGLVRPDGATITIENGVLTASGGGSGDGGYILPKATAAQLGGIKVDGTTIGVDENGVISVIMRDASEEEY